AGCGDYPGQPVDAARHPAGPRGPGPGLRRGALHPAAPMDRHASHQALDRPGTDDDDQPDPVVPPAPSKSPRGRLGPAALDHRPLGTDPTESTISIGLTGNADGGVPGPTVTLL